MGDRLVDEVYTTMSYGFDSRRLIFLDIPDNVISYFLADNNLVINARFKSGIEKFYFEVPVKVVGDINGRLLIEYIRNVSDVSKSYICVYKSGDKQKCCEDFLCTLN